MTFKSVLAKSRAIPELHIVEGKLWLELQSGLATSCIQRGERPWTGMMIARIASCKSTASSFSRLAPVII